MILNLNLPNTNLLFRSPKIIIHASIPWPKDVKKIVIVSRDAKIDISLAKWPNTLQSLYLIADTTTAKNLPDSIVELYLKLGYQMSKYRKLSDYNISSRLQSLVIEGTWNSQTFFNYFKWPETLKSLAIRKFTPLYLHALELPDSLETLFIEGQIRILHLSKWPKNLLHLKLDIGDRISVLKTLPSTLKILWLKNHFATRQPNFEEIFSHLPNLEIFVFDVYGDQRLDIKEPNFKIFVPETFDLSKSTLPSESFNFLTKKTKKLLPKVMTEADPIWERVWYLNQ